MKQQIHTFRAATMEEAMQVVRRELGQNAVVVESKPVEKRRMLPWSGTYEQIEVVAQAGPRIPVSSQTSISNTVTATGRQNVTGQQKHRTLSESKSTEAIASKLFGPIPKLPIETLNDPRTNAEEITRSGARNSRPIPLSTGTNADPVSPLAAQELHSVVDQVPPSTTVDQRHLTSLDTIVTRLEHQARSKASADIPHEFYQHYLSLIEAEVEDGIARELIGKLRLHPSAKAPLAASSLLTALVEREMRCAPPITPRPGRREIVMAFGPTGVGKTTTLAKLAGQFHLKDGLRLGLITVDTYRVGAIEQLQNYANILQVPLRTASNPGELRAAIDEMDDVDLILIDTAGRSPWDELKLRELRDLVQVSAVDHVLLVLSITSNAKMLSRIADQFSMASPTSLILTKLDEIPGHGELLSVARDIPYPVSYFATGQDVPDDIEPAHPTRMARLVLGHDQIRSQMDQFPKAA